MIYASSIKISNSSKARKTLSNYIKLKEEAPSSSPKILITTILTMESSTPINSLSRHHKKSMD